MADFYLDPEPLLRQKDKGWAGSFAKGYGLVSDIRTDQAKQAMLQQEMQRRQDEQAAMKQFAQTGDVKPLMGIDPAKAKQAGAVWDWYQEQKDPVQKDITRLTANLPTLAPMLNSQSWKTLRPQIQKSYPNVPQEALPPESATDQQLYQWANSAEILKAKIHQEGLKPTIHNLGAPGGGLQPTLIAPGQPLQPLGPPILKEYKPDKTPEEIADEAEARARGAERVTGGKGTTQLITLENHYLDAIGKINDRESRELNSLRRSIEGDPKLKLTLPGKEQEIKTKYAKEKKSREDTYKRQRKELGGKAASKKLEDMTTDEIKAMISELEGK